MIGAEHFWVFALARFLQMVSGYFGNQIMRRCVDCFRSAFIKPQCARELHGLQKALRHYSRPLEKSSRTPVTKMYLIYEGL